LKSKLVDKLEAQGFVVDATDSPELVVFTDKPVSPNSKRIGKEGQATPYITSFGEKAAQREVRTRSPSKSRKSLQQQMMAELHGAWCDFDYEKYRRTKLYMERHNLVDESNRGMIKRFESHPTFGKSFSEHQRWVKDRDQRRQQQELEEMKRDARAGHHFKYANVFYGRLSFPPEYQRVCEDLGVKLPRGERVGEDDEVVLAALDQSLRRT
jgi:hypothetical protein